MEKEQTEYINFSSLDKRMTLSELPTQALTFLVVGLLGDIFGVELAIDAFNTQGLTDILLLADPEHAAVPPPRSWCCLSTMVNDHCANCGAAVDVDDVVGGR